MNVMTKPDRASTAGARRRLLIEGWRNCNHSFALVNQNQILKLLDIPGLDLYHQDVPSPFSKEGADITGFAAAERARIAAVPALPVGARADAVLRIAAPTLPGKHSDFRKIITFMLTEIGLAASSFAAAKADIGLFTRGENAIITSTAWSKALIAGFGIPAEKIHIVPLGVNRETFYPLRAAERQASRAQLGLAEDDVLFLNIGGVFWNKGTDLLLRAFAQLRQKNPRLRLFVKDQSNVYGIGLNSMLATLAQTHAELRDPEVIAAITVIPGTLEQSQLRFLYGVADCYVSPYRAEGFNLPVLEALACKIPIITTRGGATDDFCDDVVAQKINATRTTGTTAQGDEMHYCEPDFEHLLALMSGIAAGVTRDRPYDRAREKILSAFSWEAAARQIARLTVGLNAPAPPARPMVNSFDIFDTLIARRCRGPQQIFDAIGAKIGQPHFTQARLLAESRLAGQSYTLDDIYAKMAELFDIPVAAAQALAQAEIQTELENVMPIAENLAKVEHGDVLISDMYLSPAAINALLQKAGHDKQTGLIVSTRGKHDGVIWPQIMPHFNILRHLGDNPHADIASPETFGIAAEHTSRSTFSLVEAWLEQEGLGGLALLLREARLRTTHADPALRALQNIQTQINVPILLLATAALLRVVEAQHITSLVFCSRDCAQWLELFRALRPDIATNYYYSSRIARLHPSADYLRYSHDLIKPGSMLVDVCGTGWSLSHLFARMGLQEQKMFLIHHVEKLAMYEAKRPTADTQRIYTAMAPTRKLPNVAIELVNTAEHGSALDICFIAGAAVPVFAAPWPETIRTAIRTQRQAFADTVKLLPYHNIAEIDALSPTRISALIQTLYEHLNTQTVLREVFIGAYCDEARDVHGALGLPPP